MVLVTIDSKEYEAAPDETVLEVCKKNNIFIPTLCHHPSITPYSSCRLCIVEVTQKGWAKLTASCSLPVKDGMVIATNSPRVQSGRKILMELYLARCPTSEQIKELASKLGVQKTRFKTYTDPDNKCILCGLCMRVCDEVMKVKALGFAHRGAKREIAVPFQEFSHVCMTCGACAFVCPTQCINLSKLSPNKPEPLTSDFDAGMAQRGAIYTQFPQAIPNVPVIDKEACMYALNGTCKSCENFCDKGALKYDQEDKEIKVDVGAVIISPGFDKYVPPKGDSYGYQVYPNVLTSIEFERMLSSSGPYQGHLARISDGQPPKKIAWLQCIGSRDESCDRRYCSSVCCMYATKEAIIAKEHLPGVDTHIYFMDMRSFGKDFEKYYERAKDEYGVVYRRCRIPQVEQDRKTKHLNIRYVDDVGTLQKESYDMVVLSVGLQPCKELAEMSNILEVNLNRYGFIETDPYDQVRTSRKGIYASGTVTEPKDIPESVTQASAAAVEAAKDIAALRGTEITEKVYPDEKNVSNELPRIGVFVCHCGINISGVVDVKKVVADAKALPYVVYADDSLYTCSQDSNEKIKEKIKELGLNRIVIASCTPRTHEPLFQDTLREGGLNPHLFEMANIRDQNSWVHKNNPQSSTEKAIDAVRMAVAKASDLSPIHHSKIPVVNHALIIGGGIAGMHAALSIADQGYETTLVEKEPILGGHLRDIYLGINGEKPQEHLNETIARVKSHSKIHVFTDTTVTNISGYVGNFKSQLITKEKKTPTEVEHGVTVVATGGLPYKPVEYQYEKSDDIITQIEFEKDLYEEKPYLKNLKEVAMIQCVGSRNDDHPYCSRVCCSQALKNALRFKELNPDAAVYVLYRDIRTYGFREDLLYQKARKNGILFIRYNDDDEPKVTLEEGKPLVKTKEHILNRELHLHPDKLVLSTGIIPQDNTPLAQQLKVPLNEDLFYSEAHVKLRPIDFSADGIFLCGLAHSPRFIEESILQAKAAGAHAATILSKKYLETKGNIARVISRNCAGCQLCVEMCPYDAITFDEEKKVVVINEILCQGCGACCVVCPSGVSQQNTFTKRQIVSMIDACLE
ncbi:MAG: FAD-dependent oxidoreductase [Thermoplasmata archaeon]|nr:FAD-dependent oxidoreductase [Thermoplasmata archaeon]